MSLLVSTAERDGYVIVAVAGDVDVTTAPRLRGVLHDLVAEAGRRVILDLGEVGFCDSTGLSVLISTLRRTRAAGSTFVLATVRRPLLRLLRHTGLDQIFTLHATVEDALAGSRARAGE